jgi:hypothetical protein
VFGTVAASRTGDVGVLFAAMGAGTHRGSALVLDYDCGPLTGRLFPDVAARLQALAVQTRAPLGMALLYGQPDLIRPAFVSGLNMNEIPEHLLDADQLLLPAAAHIAAGRVKLCEPAHLKAQTSPFGGALDFRGGDGGDDPLRRAALWAIALALDPPA